MNLSAGSAVIQLTGIRWKLEEAGWNWSVDLPGGSGAHFTRHASRVMALNIPTPDGRIYDNMSSGAIPDLTQDRILTRFLRKRRRVAWLFAGQILGAKWHDSETVEFDVIQIMEQVEDVAVLNTTQARLRATKLGEMEGAIIVDSATESGLLCMRIRGHLFCVPFPTGRKNRFIEGLPGWENGLQRWPRQLSLYRQSRGQSLVEDIRRQNPSNYDQFSERYQAVFRKTVLRLRRRINKR